MDVDEPHFSFEATETGLFRFKGLRPFKFSKEYPAVKPQSKTYRMTLHLTQPSFHLTVPLTIQFIKLPSNMLFEKQHCRQTNKFIFYFYGLISLTGFPTFQGIIIQK
jgi:hypothetical protein